MTQDEAKPLLAAAGFVVSSEQRANNDLGWQLRLTNGGIVNVFDTGAHSVQGKCQLEIKDALGAAPARVGAAKVVVPLAVKQNHNTKVFVVYGHNETARNHLEAMLRRWGLEPPSSISCPLKAKELSRSLKNTLLTFILQLSWPRQTTRGIVPDEMIKKHIERVRMWFLNLVCCYLGWAGAVSQLFSSNKQIWSARQTFKG